MSVLVAFGMLNVLVKLLEFILKDIPRSYPTRAFTCIFALKYLQIIYNSYKRAYLARLKVFEIGIKGIRETLRFNVNFSYLGLTNVYRKLENETLCNPSCKVILQLTEENYAVSTASLRILTNIPEQSVNLLNSGSKVIKLFLRSTQLSMKF